MADHSTAQFPKETSIKGEFNRQESAFRRFVTADGSSGFKAEPGRYHLYVSLACPWAHRTIIFRELKRLEEVVSLSVVDPVRDHRGWAFRDVPGCTSDPVNGFSFLAEAYRATDPRYAGRVTVPVLWDRATNVIVNNESSEIVRMLNSEFDAWGDASVDFYPEDLRETIDQINAKVYRYINNGVYRAGFATTQEAYDSAFGELFDALDELEELLSRQRYLAGSRQTEADWRAFTTLVRFDAVYYSHFKCNKRRLVDYPNLWGLTRDLYQIPGVAETVNMDHIKRHYFMTHQALNPSGIVPRGPEIDFDEPHDRARFRSP